MERRRRTREDIGDLWMGGLWRDRRFIELARGYWDAIGVNPTPEFFEARGLDWWSGQSRPDDHVELGHLVLVFYLAGGFITDVASKPASPAPRRGKPRIL